MCIYIYIYKPPGFATGVGDWRWWSINPRGTNQPMYEFLNKQCPGSLILSKHQHPVPNLIRSSFLPTGSTSPCNEGVIHTHEMAQEPPCPPT